VRWTARQHLLQKRNDLDSEKPLIEAKTSIRGNQGMNRNDWKVRLI